MDRSLQGECAVRKLWHDLAWDQFETVQASGDRRTLRRICKLLRDIDRNGYQTTGKPEPLKGNLSGWWSVRVDEKNRIVFRIDDGELVIRSCMGHYE